MIELENHGAVTLLKMVRGRGNALDIEFLGRMDEALQEIERSAARAVVVTGQGSVFGAGVDLPAILAGGPDYVQRFLATMIPSFERFATFPKPLVAAVNGHAIAGGAIIMMAADQRIAARGKGRIGLTEIQVGVTFPAWALEIARFATPARHFQTLVMTGRTYDPEQSLAMGVVDELVEPDKLLDRAIEVAHELGAFLPEAFRVTKLQVRRPMLEAARRESVHDPAAVEHWCSESVLAELKKFVERNIGKKSG
jgi:enoyl-CoA hydratase